MATEAESTRVDGKSAVKKANARIDEVAAALRVMLEHGEALEELLVAVRGALEWMAGTVRAYGLGDRARQACDDVREALEEALERVEDLKK